MMAALNGHIDVVVRLLAKGAAVDAKDNNGLTAREFAEHGDHQEIADLLH
jgi:ankyrin repeat protein